MCGIAGVLNFNTEKINPGLLHRMIGMIHHRGPDDNGVYTDGPIGLAHARLSIIDLAGGKQPMHNEDQSLWITFNGEIFNYVELRKELVRKGHRFSSHSDTEVLLRLFEEKGEDCVHDLNGQWAFAIWNTKTRRLFLSRDRLGVRPLFYTLTDHALIFGSEVKAILTHPDVRREIDLRALDQIFTFWFTLPSGTIFKGIQELPPGHSMVVESGKIRIRQYWRLGYHPDSESITEQECAERLLELLVDATRLRLRSDVPVGAYLSGGLDSTVITTLIKRFTDTPLKTFSVTFDDPEFDESAYQKEVIHFLETDHQEVRCTHQDIGRIFPEVVWHMEKPVLRTAPAPLFLLSKLVRDNGYKVVLTGEGSDEMLGGYDIFKETKIRRFWGAHPNSRIRPLLLKRLYPYLPNLQTQSDAYLQAFFHVKAEDRSDPFFSHLPRWDLTARTKMFFSEDVKSQLKAYDAYAEMKGLLPLEYPGWDGFSQAQYLEAAYLLPGYILSSQGDRVAMAHAVEGRFPFLDYRVVEFASRIPPRLKMKVLNEKYILKQAAGKLIPASIKKRSKQPYRAPEAQSFIGGERSVRNAYVEELLSKDRIQKDGIFNSGAVQKLVEKIQRGQTIGIKDNMALVGILSTQLVVDQFVNNFSRRSVDASD
jgi:asparagine synthase (glutamine-hydrolysing)